MKQNIGHVIFKCKNENGLTVSALTSKGTKVMSQPHINSTLLPCSLNNPEENTGNKSVYDYVMRVINQSTGKECSIEQERNALYNHPTFANYLANITKNNSSNYQNSLTTGNFESEIPAENQNIGDFYYASKKECAYRKAMEQYKYPFQEKYRLPPGVEPLDSNNDQSNDTQDKTNENMQVEPDTNNNNENLDLNYYKIQLGI